MNQTDLADVLKKRYGLRFHQQTIARIESGERPIRLNEAHLIAHALGTDVAAMTSDVGNPESLQNFLQTLEQVLAERQREMADLLRPDIGSFERDWQEYERLWHTYVSVQREQHQPVDRALSASARRVESRYRRVRKALDVIMESEA